ncbi:hypothetical protein KR044_002957, partial [Drosophila immigrans]
LLVEFSKMNLDIKSPELLAVNYVINRTSSNISAIYAEFKLSEDVVKLTGTFNLKVKHVEKFFNYITLDLDYCKGLQLLHSNHIMKSIVSELRAVTNYPLDCPLKKVTLMEHISIAFFYASSFLQNKLYYINGFSFNTNLLPSYLPEISFAVNATSRTNQRPVLVLNILGQLRRK